MKVWKEAILKFEGHDSYLLCTAVAIYDWKREISSELSQCLNWTYYFFPLGFLGFFFLKKNVIETYQTHIEIGTQSK